MTYFTGIDVSLRSVSICVVDDCGEVGRRAEPVPHLRLSSDISSWPGGQFVVSPHNGLQAVGFEVIRLEARQVKNTHGCHAQQDRPQRPVAAPTFKSAVDDPARFKSSRNVAAHFGLTPKHYQSGEMDNPGHVSRAGDADVRSALYVAAHSLLSKRAAKSP